MLWLCLDMWHLKFGSLSSTHPSILPAVPLLRVSSPWLPEALGMWCHRGMCPIIKPARGHTHTPALLRHRRVFSASPLLMKRVTGVSGDWASAAAAAAAAAGRVVQSLHVGGRLRSHLWGRSCPARFHCELKLVSFAGLAKCTLTTACAWQTDVSETCSPAGAARRSESTRKLCLRHHLVKFLSLSYFSVCFLIVSIASPLVWPVAGCRSPW